ncbi:hypothetical protein [Victivallis sp. Marseille-Q1083]|uniref:hypothetical protein n=1 Tax=Victivallis sp. Marseille-Q1083 TaxID=2717288 RepID=UPI00158E9048|nr:hypothetical protein [Victivallis sp. Marseille-Q1083]
MGGPCIYSHLYVDLATLEETSRFIEIFTALIEKNPDYEFFKIYPVENSVEVDFVGYEGGKWFETLLIDFNRWCQENFQTGLQGYYYSEEYGTNYRCEISNNEIDKEDIEWLVNYTNEEIRFLAEFAHEHFD